MEEAQSSAAAAGSRDGPVRILSIDGGGIRGIIPARVLAEIEDRSGRPISKLFDLIAGTSTGGIIACALATPTLDGSPRYSAGHVGELYAREGPRIFHRSLRHRIRSLEGYLGPKYDPDALTGILEDELGDARLTDTLTDVLLTAYDLEGRRPYFFKSTRARVEPGRDAPLRVAALATSSAPSYFPPVLWEADTEDGSGTLVDGGVFATNPAMSAYAEMRRDHPAARLLVVSLGTGEQTRPIPFQAARGFGRVKWATRILDVVFDGVADTTDYHLRHLIGDRYRRLQIELGTGMGSDDLDDASEGNIDRLRRTAESLVRDRSEDIDAIIAAVAPGGD